MPAEASPNLAPPTQANAPEQSAERPASRSRILVVDDHEDNIEVLRVRLESWGYGTDAVYDGAAALKYVESTPPDLILLDVMMPEISGIEVARRIKANRALPFIPIIMQTALDSTGDKVEGLEAGGGEYNTKAIAIAECKGGLRSMVRNKPPQEAAGGDA